MKKILYFSILCIIWISNLGGCEDCQLHCENGGIRNRNDDNCYCDCPAGFYGTQCEHSVITNRHKLHADISYVGTSNSYSYDPSDCFVHVYDHSTDTVWIDGFDSSAASDNYCFLRLYINDNNTITNGSSFPIKDGNAIGSCWAAYKEESTGLVYTVDPSFSGALKIDVYNPGTLISGTFNFNVKNGSTVLNVKGWFEDYD